MSKRMSLGCNVVVSTDVDAYVNVCLRMCDSQR